MAELIRQSFRIDSGVAAGDVASLHIAVEVITAQQALLAAEPIILICLPGGGMNRRYYDLQAADGDDSYSFAAQMTRRGFIVASVDHAGIGESDKPEDGYALTPEIITQAGNTAIGKLLAGLRAGTLSPNLSALPRLKSIIIGHSMGALLSVLQQVDRPLHAAVAVLGFGTRGLPDYLPPQARELASDTEAVRKQLVPLAKMMFVEPYPVVRSPSRSNGDIYGGQKAEPAGIVALKAATAHILPVTAFLSMLPGNILPETNRIDVPVFIGVGERDMVGIPHEIPASFRHSPDVTLLVLPETGHSHFLFSTRTRLFDRLADWAQSVIPHS